MGVVFIILKANRNVSEEEVMNILPGKKSLAERGLKLEKVTVLEE